MFLHLLWQILRSLSLQCTIYICSILSHRKVKTGYHQDSAILISVPITSDFYFEILPPTISIIWDINRGWLRSKKPPYKRYHICSTVFWFHIQYKYIALAAKQVRKTHKRLVFLPVSKACTDKFIRTYILFILQHPKGFKKNGQIIW